jgi:hypothetical protein
LQGRRHPPHDGRRDIPRRRKRRNVVVHLSIEYSPCRGLLRPTPLLEEERDIGLQASIPNSPNPVRIHRPRASAAFTANDDPAYPAEIEFAEVFEAYERLMDNFEFSQALAKVWEAETALDKYITDKKPWGMAKKPERHGEMADVFYTLAEGLRMLASLIYPAVPTVAEEIWKRLGLEKSPVEVPWAEQKRWGLLRDGLKVSKGAPLFPRLQ